MLPEHVHRLPSGSCSWKYLLHEPGTMSVCSSPLTQSLEPRRCSVCLLINLLCVSFCPLLCWPACCLMFSSVTQRGDNCLTMNEVKVVPPELPVGEDSGMLKCITDCMSSSWQRKFEINVFCSSFKKCSIRNKERQFLGLSWPRTNTQLPPPSMPVLIFCALSYHLSAWIPELPPQEPGSSGHLLYN